MLPSKVYYKRIFTLTNTENTRSANTVKAMINNGDFNRNEEYVDHIVSRFPEYINVNKDEVLKEINAKSPITPPYSEEFEMKELKECRTSLKIIIKKDYIRPSARVTPLFQETEELIAIIGKSIATAEKNKGNS